MKDKLVNSLYVENQMWKFVKEFKLKFRNQITSRKRKPRNRNFRKLPENGWNSENSGKSVCHNHPPIHFWVDLHLKVDIIIWDNLRKNYVLFYRLVPIVSYTNQFWYIYKTSESSHLLLVFTDFLTLLRYLGRFCRWFSIKRKILPILIIKYNIV